MTIQRTLADWMAEHGPLSPSEALGVALRASARASAMPAVELAAALPSLHAGCFTRMSGSGWEWEPAPSARASRAVADRQIVERISALLVHSLTGVPLAAGFDGEGLLLKRMLARRPDLPPAVADLAAQGASAAGTVGTSLAAFARELRALLGAAPRRRPRWGRWAVAAGIVVAVAAASGVFLSGAAERAAESSPAGLTAAELDDFAIAMETTDHLALIDEHTASTQMLAEVERVWQSRFDVADPRLAWLGARQAWVRQLAGDRITAEQVLETLPPKLDAALGPDHPYSRAVRLELASILDARGARDAATALRDEAARAWTMLLGEPPAPARGYAGVSWPPHVVAHVAPNAPVREGFRPAPDGRSIAMPLTSTQRRLSWIDGWRLHVRAEGACRVSLVTGAEPRAVAVVAEPVAAGGWNVRVEGVTPPVVLRANAGPSADVTITAAPGGALAVRAGVVAEAAARIDAAAPPPAPPYAFDIAGDARTRGCTIVWWEIVPR